METNEKTPYLPIEPVHPYEILEDELRARGISKKEFASRLGMKASNFSRMLKDRGSLSSEMALRLEKELEIPYLDWMRYQETYLKDVERLDKQRIEEGYLASREASINAVINLDILYKVLGLFLKPIKERVKGIEKFMPYIYGDDIPCIGKFKKSELRQTDERNLLTWILIAIDTACRLTSGMTYREGSALTAARELAAFVHSHEIITQSEIQNILNSHGIGYGVVHKFEKTPVDAFSTTRGTTPCVIVTCRIDNMDKLVFDVLHELGHIHLHLERGMKKEFLNDAGGEKDKLEKEADEFARNTLIPLKIWKEIMSVSLNNPTPQRLSKLIGDKAKTLGICPTIAVSRYRHESQKYNLWSYRSPKII